MNGPLTQGHDSLTVPKSVLSHDVALIGSMMILAACGLIYEYLLAHYAARIVGAVETSIYGMIGIMIVAMGIGAFLAKWVRCPFTGFAWLEVSIAFLGGLRRADHGDHAGHDPHAAGVGYRMSTGCIHPWSQMAVWSPSLQDVSFSAALLLRLHTRRDDRHGNPTHCQNPGNHSRTASAAQYRHDSTVLTISALASERPSGCLSA